MQSLQDDTPAAERSDDSSGWLVSAALVLAGIILPLIAWTNRPLELRTYGAATMAQMSGEWVFRSSYYYASLVFSALLIVAGVTRMAFSLLSRNRR